MPLTSPFKFLDAYNKEDKDIFFGRDDEVEQLYELVFESNLTLVYGQSGTGKTSLVQCGLANRFAVTDWFNVYIRRNENINQSLLRSLKRHEVKENRDKGGFLRERLMKKREGVRRIEVVESPEQREFIRSLRSIYKHYLKPVFLIFDQFEELFILGNRAEQQAFYATIAQILDSEPYCRVILIMREEAIAQLYDFEKIVPPLFDKRLRVERMSRTDTQEVIIKSCSKFEIALESGQIPGQIIDVLSAGQGRVELTYLQVFLDRLYQEAAKDNPSNIVFTADQIARLGTIENILGDFLEKQIKDAQPKVRQRYPDVPRSSIRKVLSTFVTLEGTKRPQDIQEIRVGALTPEQVTFIVKELENDRILRFENNLYELSHDALAQQVANARSADEVALLQISKIVKDRYQVFDTTKTLLNANELQLTGAFRENLIEEHALSAGEWDFVRKSVQANRRRRLSRVTAVLSIIAVLTAFALYSKIQTTIIQEAKSQQEEMSFNLLMTYGNQYMYQDLYEKAQEVYNDALRIKPHTQEAIDSIQSARDKAKKRSEFDQLFEEGDMLTRTGSTGDQIKALDLFRRANRLGVNKGEVEGKIKELEGSLSGARARLKNQGEVYFRAANTRGYRLALERYELVAEIETLLKINPKDKEVAQRIKECKYKLE
ncbi:MAG: ATP-binding protein [Saprospiraceae bacterium]|nr:ATP-binding protein [Lewinella sp.]